MFNGKRQDAFPPKIRDKTKMSTLTTSIQNYSRGSRKTTYYKEIKGIQILSVENSKEFKTINIQTKKLIQLIHEFSKTAGSIHKNQ